MNGAAPSQRPLRWQNREIDWPAIERDYRAGSLSLRELGVKHGCSHSTIANFAARNGWVRDGRLPARLAAAAGA